MRKGKKVMYIVATYAPFLNVQISFINFTFLVKNIKMKGLLAASMLMIHVHWIPQEKYQNPIETTGTPHHQLCISSLHINADVAGLGLIMVDAMKAKDKEMSNAIKKLKGSWPELRNALNKCTDVYNAILEADVLESVEALTKGDPKFAKNGMADSSMEAVLCNARTV